MKVIFGVQGEGMGHAMRSRLLIERLSKKHEVMVFASDRAYKYLASKFKNVHEIECFKLIYKDNRVAMFATLRSNILSSGKHLESLKKVRDAIRTFRPDVIVSDYEPITNLAATFAGCRHISVDNQNDITLRKCGYPLKEIFSFINTKLVTFLFTAGADKYVIYSLKTQNSRGKKIYVGNLIKKELLCRKSRYGNHIFIYQTSKTNHRLIDVLKGIDEKFIIYGFDKNEKDNNITFRKFNDDVFFKDFCECKAVIMNGGLTTITEAVFLKKPILAVPIKGQFEQYFNASTIQSLGFGMCMEKPDKEIILKFIRELPKYKEALKKYKAGSNEDVFEKIEEVLKLSD